MQPSQQEEIWGISVPLLAHSHGNSHNSGIWGKKKNAWNLNRQLTRFLVFLRYGFLLKCENAKDQSKTSAIFPLIVSEKGRSDMYKHQEWFQRSLAINSSDTDVSSDSTLCCLIMFMCCARLLSILLKFLLCTTGTNTCALNPEPITQRSPSWMSPCYVFLIRKDKQHHLLSLSERPQTPLLLLLCCIIGCPVMSCI